MDSGDDEIRAGLPAWWFTALVFVGWLLALALIFFCSGR